MVISIKFIVTAKIWIYGVIMYISVESYEEMYLKEKSEEAILSEVGKMRNQIKYLKDRIENPSFAHEAINRAERISTLGIYRSYLLRAARVLSERRGGADVFSEEERVAIYFNDRLESLSEVSLLLGKRKFSINLANATASVKDAAGCEHVADRMRLFSDLRSLYMGEWRDRYLPSDYGCVIISPIIWNLRLSFNDNSADREYSGEGVYPYNFENLLRIIGVSLD